LAVERKTVTGAALDQRMGFGAAALASPQLAGWTPKVSELGDVIAGNERSLVSVGIAFASNGHSKARRCSGVLNGGSAGISIGALVAVAAALYIVLVVRRRK
jgi:hypothetical protein